MQNFFKKFLSFFQKDTKPELTPALENIHSLGANLSDADYDNRDIPLATIQKPITLPDEYETDLSIFAIFDQGALGTCVAHAFALTKMFLDYMETKNVVIYSRRWIYALTRVFAGGVNTDDMSNQGLSPRQASKILSTLGVIKDSGQDDNTLPHSKYVNNYTVTDTMRKDAVLNRAGKYAFPYHDIESFRQAIYQNKLIPATIGIDWLKIDPDGTVHKPIQLAGSHEIVFCGYSKETQKFKFRNSWNKYWGTNGYGYVPYSEIESVVYDSIAFTDVPNDLIERAKNMQYIFTADLSFGTSGTAVSELQKRLISYGLLQIDTPTAYFGQKTVYAVKDFQALKGINTTGYVGTLTRAALNAETPSGQIKSKIDLWVEAATKMEGASPSLRNPGNLKCNGIMNKNATGMDSRGFCIFPTETIGYGELRNLFVRACTGKSTNYVPNMTMYEFYAGVEDPKKYGHKIDGYAPESDGNMPNHYAEFVAKEIGVDPTIQIKDLI